MNDPSPNNRIIRWTGQWGPSGRAGWTVCLLACLLVIVICPSVRANPEPVPRGPDRLIAVIPDDNHPQSFRDRETGEAAGFAVDVTNELARIAGFTVSYVLVDHWEEALDKIQSGEADLVSGLAISPDRERLYSFTEPFDIQAVSLFARAGSGKTQLKEGDTVGVIRGSVAKDRFSSWPGIRVSVYDNFATGFFDLISGKIDALACPAPIFWYLVEKAGVNDHITVIDKPLSGIKRAIAVAKGRTELVDRVNKAIPGFVGSSEYQKLYSKWYGQAKPFYAVSKQTLGIVLAIALVTVAMAAWRHVSVLGVTRRLRLEVAERAKAEDALRHSEQFIRGIHDTVDDGLIVVDRDLRVVSANRAYCQQTGMSLEDVLGRLCCEPGEECAAREVLQTGEARAVLHRHEDEKGNVLFEEKKAFPLKDASGVMTGAIEVIHDVTERYLLEEERLKTQKLEAIGTLAGGIAHDFNNLLQGVFGYVSMAKMSVDEPEKAREMLEEAEKALSLSVNLTTQLLTFAKGGKPVKSTTHLAPLIESATKFALSGSRFGYRLNLAPDLWPADVDGGQISQVIQNIVLNASEAMPVAGAVEVSAENVYLPEEGRQVRIAIKDTGIGIPESYRSKIFDPYFTTKQKGSGLGLATSYSIVKNHGGTIDVVSAPNAGTTFQVTLPACDPAVDMGPPRPVSSDTGKRRGRVLLMDDEAMVRGVARNMIEALGHEVELASHGEEAIGKFEGAIAGGRPFDLVILDLTVKGGMGGEETVRRLREIDPFVKAVVSSGYADDPVLSDYRTHGFSAILGKPYSVRDLKACLANWLDETEQLKRNG